MTNLAEALQAALEHHRTGRLTQAEQLYRAILQTDPRNADALHLLGVLAHQNGQHDIAIEQIKLAIGLQPNCAAYHNNLGLAYRGLRKLVDARACHETALQLDPSYASAHANLGWVLRELGQPVEALASYQQAVRCQAGGADAHFALGKLHQELGRPAEALTCFDEALRLQPQAADAHHHRGEALEDLARPAEALASFQQAVRCRPQHVEARQNAGYLLEALGRHAEASDWWTWPLHDAPDDGARVKALLSAPGILQSEQQFLWRRKQLETGLAILEAKRLAMDDPLTQVNTTNFYAAYHGLNDRLLQGRLAALFARATPALQYVAPHCQQSGCKGGQTPLRVGFISRFFHMHTIGEVNLGLVRHLSRQVCRVILFTLPGPEDFLAKLLRESADEVVPLTPTLDAARRQIADQRLDVLFYTDIGMDPFTYFLAFARLAPVQCTTWGHPVTTGIPNVDYYLSSAALEPADADAHYTEQLVRLRGLPTYYFAPAFFPPAKTRGHFGLPDDEHLYLCPQAPFKVHPDYDSLVGDILRGDPLGRVLFVRGHNPAWTHQLLRRFHQTLPDVVDRIHFLPHQGGQDYLHLLNVCDAVLDTTHFGGGNTTYKALSVAAPIVTLPGAFARGRVTSGCYQKMGVRDCIAADRADYVCIAHRLATDRPWREDVRSRLRAAHAVLYEDAGVLRELEQFFLQAVAAVPEQEKQRP